MNIRVALTTTRFITKSDNSLELMEIFRNLDVPVCIAEMRLGLFGADLEKIEHYMARSAISIARTVKVDPEHCRVFIGENPLKEDTGLVSYQERSLSSTSNAFFQQWGRTHTLVFEFHVLNMVGEKPRYVIQGIWGHDSWSQLEIIPSPRITIEDMI